jgi:L-2-hydroxyglutarate oxidase LhgO
MRLGKLIVATNEAEVGQLERIAAAGAGNGVDDLKWLSGEEARTLEPALNAEVAILSPSTGIVDSHALMLSYLGEAEDAGAVIAFETKVTQAAIETDGVALWVNGDSAPALKAQLVINAAGLSALDLARAFEGYAADVPAPKQFAKGNYFTLAGRAPFSHLIYPAPEPGGLGVHLTLDLGGQGKFGPDVEWIESIDYDVDPTRCEKFYAAVRKYWPSLKDDALTPAYAGVRPKIVGQGEAAGDFVIAGPETHGAPGLINLFGIESPGLTSSLAIADEVARIAAETR